MPHGCTPGCSYHVSDSMILTPLTCFRAPNFWLEARGGQCAYVAFTGTHLGRIAPSFATASCSQSLSMSFPCILCFSTQFACLCARPWQLQRALTLSQQGKGAGKAPAKLVAMEWAKGPANPHARTRPVLHLLRIDEVCLVGLAGPVGPVVQPLQYEPPYPWPLDLPMDSLKRLQCVWTAHWKPAICLPSCQQLQLFSMFSLVTTPAAGRILLHRCKNKCKPSVRACQQHYRS